LPIPGSMVRFSTLKQPWSHNGTEGCRRPGGLEVEAEERR